MTYTYTYARCPGCARGIMDVDEHGNLVLWPFCPWCGRDLRVDDPTRARIEYGSRRPGLDDPNALYAWLALALAVAVVMGTIYLWTRH
jgi:hypothetical protein